MATIYVPPMAMPTLVLLFQLTENYPASQEQAFSGDKLCLFTTLLAETEPWKLPRHCGYSVGFWMLIWNGPKPPHGLFTVSSIGIRSFCVPECPWAYHKYFRIPKMSMHMLGPPVILGCFDLVRNSTFYYFVSKGRP